MNLRKLYRFHIHNDIFPIYWFQDGEKIRRIDVTDPKIYRLKIRNPPKNGRNKRWATLYSEDKEAGVSKNELRIPNRQVKHFVGLEV